MKFVIRPKYLFFFINRLFFWVDIFVKCSIRPKCRFQDSVCNKTYSFLYRTASAYNHMILRLTPALSKLCGRYAGRGVARAPRPQAPHAPHTEVERYLLRTADRSRPADVQRAYPKDATQSGAVPTC